MQRDFRDTDEFLRVSRFYEALVAPGAGHVYAAPEAAPSPDGTRAYITGLSFAGALEDGPSRALYEVDLASGEMRGHGAGRLPRPSPDGASLAFVAPDGEADGEALRVMDVADGRVRHSIAIEGLLEDLAWSPDGGRLLLLTAGRGADVAGYQGGYATRARLEGPSWLPDVKTNEGAFLWRRLSILDVGAGVLSAVTTDGVNVWEASWCGDEALAYVRSDHHGEGSWYRSSLAVFDLKTGRERPIYQPVDQIGLPAGSPDARHVAFVEAVCSDRGIVCGALKLATVDGEVRDVDTGEAEITALVWRDSSTLHFAGQRRFQTVVGDVHFDGRGVVELWRSWALSCGEWYPAAWPLPDGRSLVVAEAYDVAPQLTVLSAEGARVVRSFASAAAGAALASCGSVSPVTWRAPDGLEIDGWLVAPPSPHGRVPLVLDIHGGPVWAHRNRWAGRLRTTPLLVRAGCAVLYPNPRGSSTRGQDFARRVKGDMGGADTGDFIAALDHFIELGLADPAKLACTGCSYGGFMSAWLVTQDQRFAAAAPISPVTNWYSQHRTCQIPEFDEMFLADSASRPAGRFFERSPVMFADRVRTPCLILAGALDKNTPPSQALEFHQSLHEHGAESTLVVYPGDGHSLRGYPAFFDSAARILAWFDVHLRLGPA